jgi:glycosyltransferase involved in cell wall biosynthesis
MRYSSLMIESTSKSSYVLFDGPRPPSADLTSDLGFRPPTSDELTRILWRHAKSGFRRRPPFSKPAVLQLSIISADPFIAYSGITQAPLGLASELPRRRRNRNAWFLLSPTWSLEREFFVEALRGYAVIHRLLHPGHRLIFLCNTQSEVEIVRSHGEAALFHSKTSSTSEHVFRPLECVPVEFDAIYNAQLRKWKRHELSLSIERCAFVYYRDETGSNTPGDEAALIARHAEQAPGHVFLNRLDEVGFAVRLQPDDVNFQLNRAAVGLCLSETEGPMFACIEYLLAGLPVVTTPNRGGRDVYMDDDYCITADADPRSVADAVAALRSRQIPRSYVRQKTLERIQPHRQTLVDVLNRIFAEAGSDQTIDMPWPFRRPVLMQWRRRRRAVRRALAGEVDAFHEPAD